MGEEEKIIANVETASAIKNLADLRKEIKEAKSAMLTATQGTKEWQAALERAASAQFQMKELNEIVRGSAMDLGEALGQATKVASGMVGGFNAVVAISTLMGVENDRLKETFVKLQAGMALVQGLSGIDGMIKGFSNLGNVLRSTSVGIKAVTAVQWLWNKAVLANPIVAFAAAIVALGGAIYGLTKILSSNNDEQERMNRSYDLTLERLTQINKQTEYNARLLKAAGKDDLEVEQMRKAAIAENISQLRKYIELVEKGAEKRTGAESKLLKAQFGSIQQAREALPELKKSLDEQTEAYRQSLEDINVLQVKADADSKKHADDKAKKDADDAKKAADKAIEEKRRELDEINKLNAAARLTTMDERAQEYARLEEKYAKQRELFQKHNADMKVIEEAYKAEKTEIDERNKAEDFAKAEEDYERERSYRLLMIKLEQDEKAKAIELAQLEADEKARIDDAYKAHKEQMTNAIAGLADTMSAVAGRETGVGKALAVAATTISTWSSAQKAYEAAFLPIPTAASPILAGLNVAAAVGMGMANIRNILKVKVPKAGGASGGGGIAAASSQIAIPNAPNMEQRISAMRNVQTPSEIELQKRPMKAYVVESEFSEVKGRVDTIRKEATFG